LLIRGNKVIKELARRPQLPLGLAELHMGTDRSIYRTLPHNDDDATIVLIEWMPPPVKDHSLPKVSGGQQSQPGQAGTKRKARVSLGTPADCRNLRGSRAETHLA
jgi:hypothetical protein